MYLLDTNIVSYWMRGDQGVMDRIKGHSPGELALSTITLAEIIYGIDKSPVKKNERRARIDRICSQLDIYAFDEAAAEKYGPLRAALERRGCVISERDLQIAAIALANRLRLVTHNTREFKRLDGMIVEDWAQDCK